MGGGGRFGLVGIPFGVCEWWASCGWVWAAASVERRVARRSRGGRSASSGGRFARGVRAWWECVRGRACVCVCVCVCGCVVGCYSPGGMWVVVPPPASSKGRGSGIGAAGSCGGRGRDFGVAGSRAFDRGV